MVNREGKPIQNVSVRLELDKLAELDAEGAYVESVAGFKPARSKLLEILAWEALAARRKARQAQGSLNLD